jgi:tetratricopeptide (TPR) repeat protein
MMPMRIWGALALIVTLASPARADEMQEARDHYRRAIKAYEVADYEEAIREFAATYKIKDDPSMLFNLAQAYRLGGRRDEALRTYRMFLSKVPNAPNRHEVEVLIEGLQQSRPPNAEDPDSELARRYSEAGAKKYDLHDYEGAITQFEKARVIKPVAALDFDIGRAHDRLGHIDLALVAYRRYVSAKPEPSEAAEIRARITILEQRQASQAPPSKTEPTPPVPAQPLKRDVAAGRNLTTAGIAITAVGAAALIGGVACGVLAKQNSDDLTKLAQTMGRYSAAKDTAGKNEQIAEGVLLGVGGAAVVTGVVLIMVGQRAHRRALALLPDVDQRQAGLVLEGSF